MNAMANPGEKLCILEFMLLNRANSLEIKFVFAFAIGFIVGIL